MRDGENSFRLERDYPSDYTALVRTAPDTLQTSLRNGFVKEYKLVRGEFRLTRVTDRNGNVVQLIYEDGFLAKMQNANHWIAFSRDKKGRIVLAQDDQGRKVSYAYDEKGWLIEADDLGGFAWAYRYGGAKRLVAATDPLERLNFAVAYDGPGRVARLQLPSGAIQYFYDPSTRSTNVIDRKQLTSHFFQNEDGITTRVVNALGEETSIALDSSRNVTSLTRNGLLVESMEYDQQHRLVFRQSITDSGTVNREYAYDAVTGLLTGIHPGTGSDQSFGYDGRSNLTTASLPGGPHSFAYFPAGDLAQFSAETTNLRFAPDADGLIASMTDQQNAVTTMKYKAGGELAAATFPGGARAEYQYQPSGLRSKLVYADGRRVEYAYDPAGNLTGTRVFDAKGKQVNGQQLEMNVSYQLVRWVLFDGTETTFQYDANGNLTQIAKGDSITRFQYDPLDRLVAVDTPDGQRLTYDYKPGERSLVEQYEHASVPVADLRDTGFTFASPFATMDSRPLTAQFGAVRFAESLGTFQLANSDGSEIVRPHDGTEAALAKLHLFQPGMTQKALRSGFNAPFNNMFVPAEYFTINCCPECYFDGERWFCPPCEPPPPPPPTIRIRLGGPSGTDITGTTQSVVVGQQIALYASYVTDEGVDSQTWSVPGNIVGGFVHDLSNGGPSPISLNGVSTTFYWTTAASSQRVTFTLNLTDGNSGSASATFNIAGPTATNISTQLGQVVITGSTLGFGGTPSNVGIKFTASATPPTGYSNSFVWVQINTNDTTAIVLNNNATATCAPATIPSGGDPFLDSTYPYDTNNPTNDNPDGELDSSTFKEATRTFSAKMYLMWSSGSANSIPVPLGSVVWQWSGDAVYNGSNWTLNSSSRSANPFQTSSLYPTWSRYSDYSSVPCH